MGLASSSGDPAREIDGLMPPPSIYKQGNAPDQSTPQGQIGPIPWVDDLWVDIVNHILKQCVSINPYIWVSVAGASSGASINDPFVTWSSAPDLTDQRVIGTFLTSVLQTSLPFSGTGTILSPTAPVNVITWQAPFAATVTNVRGYLSGSTGSTVNARKNGTLTHLASDLTISSADTWIDGGAVQNTAYAIGDKLEILLTGVSGTPTQVAIQVWFTRP
jgi:hypothetical protein